MKIPFFSVVMTTFNRAKCIEQTLESIFNQSFSDYELILVDDCSTDNTSVVISKFENVVYFCTPYNTGGPAIPRNIGIDNSKGKWICFCDSDDLYSVEHLQNIYNSIVNNHLSNCMISTNAYVMNNGHKETTELLNFKFEGMKEISFESNFLNNKSILSSLCVCNNGNTHFREDKKYNSFEDYLYVLDNMTAGMNHYILNEPSVFYDISSPDSIRIKFKTENLILKAKKDLYVRMNKKLIPLYFILSVKLYLKKLIS